MIGLYGKHKNLAVSDTDSSVQHTDDDVRLTDWNDCCNSTTDWNQLPGIFQMFRMKLFDYQWFE